MIKTDNKNRRKEQQELNILLKNLPKPVKEYIKTLQSEKLEREKVCISFIKRIREQNNWLKFFGKLPNDKFKAVIPLNEYPLGTKALTDTGFYWTKTAKGWKFTNGNIVEIPDKSFNGYIMLPNNT